MTAPVSTERRLQALEAEAFRSGRQAELLDERLAHITGALGELSQQNRAVGLDTREVRTELTALRETQLAHHAEQQADTAALKADVTDLKASVAQVVRLLQAISGNAGEHRPSGAA